MAKKKPAETTAKVGIKLSSPQRKLLLEEPISHPQGACRAHPQHGDHRPGHAHARRLEDLAGHVAAEANHTKDKALRKKLDAIFAKIQDVLGDPHRTKSRPSR